MIDISAQFRLPRPLAEGEEPPFGTEGIKEAATAAWGKAHDEATAPVDEFYETWQDVFLAANAITRYGLVVHAEFSSDEGSIDIYPGTSSLKSREALRLLLDEDGLEGWAALGSTTVGPLISRATGQEVEVVSEAMAKAGSATIRLEIRSWQVNDAAPEGEAP